MLLTFCADNSALGRFDPSLISDQDRMEMLVTPIEDDNVPLYEDESKLSFKDKNGDFRKVILWNGVECDTNGSVVKIDWSMKNWACGKVSLDLLPPKLITLDIRMGLFSSWQVRGTISTFLLPRGLETLIISGQSFSGTIDLSALPSPMTTFEAYFNSFEGSINLECLPSGMQKIDLTGNILTGTLCLTKLPATMRRLLLSRNLFRGTITFESLPCMDELDLSDNELVGNPSLDGLPAKFGKLQVDKNHFRGGWMNQKMS